MTHAWILTASGRRFDLLAPTVESVDAGDIAHALSQVNRFGGHTRVPYSVAEHSPSTATFQHVADLRLRAFAPASDRHRRIDDWTELGAAIEAAVRR